MASTAVLRYVADSLSDTETRLVRGYDPAAVARDLGRLRGLLTAQLTAGCGLCPDPIRPDDHHGVTADGRTAHLACMADAEAGEPPLPVGTCERPEPEEVLF